MFGKKVETQIPDSQIFVYYDSKSKTYGVPMFAINQHALIRDITNMLRDPESQTKSQLYLNAEDFSVFKIGTYDKSTGTLVAQHPEHIVNLHDLRAIIDLKRDYSQKPYVESQPKGEMGIVAT